jgi:hypothetical protein
VVHASVWRCGTVFAAPTSNPRGSSDGLYGAVFPGGGHALCSPQPSSRCGEVAARADVIPRQPFIQPSTQHLRILSVVRLKLCGARMEVALSRGDGEVRRKLITYLLAKRGHWNAATLAKVVYGGDVTPSRLNSVNRALSALAKQNRVVSASSLRPGGARRWTAHEVKRPPKKKSRSSEQYRPIYTLTYRPNGRPTRRDEHPGQLELWESLPTCPMSEEAGLISVTTRVAVAEPATELLVTVLTAETNRIDSSGGQSRR